MIVKLSFLAVASFATFVVSQINTKPTTRNQNYATNPPDNVSNFQKQQSEKEDEDELANSDAQKDEEEKAKKLIRRTMLNNVKETKKLVKELEERKMTLEGKLLVLHNFQEKQSSKTQLQIQLEEKLSEIEMLKVSLASLQSERKNLKDEIKQSILAKKQLEMAKKTIAEMQQKMDAQTRHIKGQLLMIGEKVCGFQNNEISDRDFLLEKKLREVKNVELEVVVMKRKNKEIELEKRELSLRMFASQAKITSLSNITEGKIVAKIEEKKTMLRHANEHLSKQIEILQKNKFDMVQELVYQRWLQSCLRFEIQNKSNPPRQTSSNPKLSSIPCPNSHVEIEPLVLDSSSSYTSSSTNHGDEVDTTTNESSSSSQKSKEKNPFSMHNIKRWWRRRSKDDKSENSLSNTDEIHSFSSAFTSPSMKKIEHDFSDDQASKPSPRVRRVSFNDLDKSDKPKSDEKEIIGGYQRGCQYNSSTSMNSSCFKFSRDSFEGNEHDPVAILSEKSNLEPINGGGSKIEMDIISSKKMSHPSMQASDQLSDKENRVVETHMFNFVAALLFFFLFLMSCIFTKFDECNFSY